MKVKSMIAALAASAIALGTMAVSASAALTNPNNDKKDSYVINLPDEVDNWFEVQGAKVTLTVADGWNAEGTGGGVIFQGKGLEWGDGSKEFGISGEGEDVKGVAGVSTGGEGTNTVYVVYDYGSAIFADLVDDEEAWGQFIVQSWWGGDITVEKVEFFYEGDEVPVLPQDFELPSNETSASETSGTASSSGTTSSTKTSGASGSSSGSTKATSTGDAGVGVAVAALSLAGIAAYVSRKKN